MPKPFWDLLEGVLIDKEGKEYTVADVKSNDVVGIYFSASWCGPCLAFTPNLIKAYNKLKQEGKKFEIIFASGDQDESSCMEYFSKMPWKAFPFGDKRESLLKQKFQVRGIPTLVLVSSSGKVISTQGRSLIEEEPEAFPWLPKPLSPIGMASVDILNNQPVLLLFPQEAKKSELVEMLEGVAEEYAKKFEEKKKKGADEEDPLTFLYDNKSPLVAKISQVFGIPTTRPFLAILDVQNQSKYYYQGTITEESLRDFIEQFLSGKLSPLSIRG